ncbi:MAG TPA: hypothetical protein VLL05_07415 [Terriglobales bacterium]|nr:hypothetical protein [Terriglobales bacterium]
MSAPSGAQTSSAPAPQNTPQADNPELVTCGEKPPFASRTARGNTLVAPDQKHRAYTEVEATALYAQRPSGYSGPLCINNSRLLLAGDTGEFKLRFLQEPADVENGNSLRLVDWSADSRRLLAELTEWQYEQPGSNRGVLVFDSRTGTFQQPDLGRSLAKAYAHDCAMNLRVLGFGMQGTIIMEGQPLTPEEEEVSGTSSCAKKKTFFELDRATENLVSVPEMPKLQHNAKAESAK